MERRCVRVILIVAAMTCLVSLGQSQPPAAREDRQSSYEPRSGPGAGQKFLEVFVGAWDVTKTFYPRSGGQPVRAQGQCRQTMIHDGRFLQSEFLFDAAGRKTTGLGLTGFEPASGRFTSVWTDSRQTRMSIRQSREPFNGKEIVLFSRSLDEAGTSPGPAPSRTVTRLEDGGKTIVHRQFTAGPDGQERVIMELIMIRASTAPSSGR
jgi:Protein of unknown function (DUF1579)